MALVEKLKDRLYVSGLTSIGRTIPDRFSQASDMAGLPYKYEELPQVIVDISLNEENLGLPFHCGVLDRSSHPPTLRIPAQTVLAKATEIRRNFDLKALGVDPNVDDINMFNTLPPIELLGVPVPRMRTTIVDDYCAHVAMINLALQTVYQNSQDIGKAEKAYSLLFLNNHG